jgi:Pup amidohydrolase
MSVRRVMGTEVEYGISVAGQPGANPMVASSQIVNAYATSTVKARRARWDFEEESPLRDARGFDMSRQVADQSQLTDEDLGLANVILTNGARLYVDHAHPEYATPETTNPLDVVRWDKAGEQVMLDASRFAAQSGLGAPIVLYKNNTDNKGASYGAHENYLMRRSTPFGEIVRHLTPFFVSRQVVCGAGRVGIGQDGRDHGFQVSQRADFFEVEVGLETTLKRPIINTRDEPHADPEKYRRLHVIVGDSNMSEYAVWLKVATADFVLRMIEAGTVMRDLTLDNPIRAIREISHDMTCQRRVKLAGGREMSALEIQQAYLERVERFVASNHEVDDEAKRVVGEWRYVLEHLVDDPMTLGRQLDWVAKYQLIDSYRTKHDLGLADPRVHLLDLAYHDVVRDRGLYHLLVRQGRMQRLLEDPEIDEAAENPPPTTRAALRGRFIRTAKARRRDYTVDWVHLKLNDQAQRTVLCKDPFRYEDERVDRLIAAM